MSWKRISGFRKPKSKKKKDIMIVSSKDKILTLAPIRKTTKWIAGKHYILVSSNLTKSEAIKAKNVLAAKGIKAKYITAYPSGKVRLYIEPIAFGKDLLPMIEKIEDMKSDIATSNIGLRRPGYVSKEELPSFAEGVRQSKKRLSAEQSKLKKLFGERKIVISI